MTVESIKAVLTQDALNAELVKAVRPCTCCVFVHRYVFMHIHVGENKRETLCDVFLQVVGKFLYMFPESYCLDNILFPDLKMIETKRYVDISCKNICVW